MDEGEGWVKLVDRGGLTHITTTMFYFMKEMEKQVKSFLMRPRQGKTGDIRAELVSSNGQRCPKLGNLTNHNCSSPL